MIDAVRSRADDPWANGDLAMFLHAHKRLDAAAPLYERAQALSGGEFRWSYLLGVCRQESGLHKEAANAFRRALAVRSYAPAAIRLGELLAAAELPGEAATALRDALRFDGNDAAASYALGQLLLDLGVSDEAIPLLERAAALSPESGAARYALGMAHRAEGDEDKARHLLANLAGGERTKPPIEDPILARVEGLAADEHYFLNLGKRQETAGSLAEAIDSYKRALALDADMATVHANLVGAYGRLGDFENARAHYDAAHAVDPDIEELHNNWGVLQAARGSPSGAAAAFRRALEINPNSAKAHANLGVALTELGDTRVAARHFRNAIENDPTNRPARTNLGALALEDGRAAEAVEHLEAALMGSEDGNEAFIRYVLGVAYGRAGRASDSSRSLERALGLAEAREMADLVVQIRKAIESSGIHTNPNNF